jgi:Mrp family chromosome partitioning ATPase
MSPMKKRTTVMGLAPAPHLGGLSGSPGAIARAEAAARKQRLLSALVSTTGADAPRSGGSESSRPEGYTTSSSSARNVAMREPAPEVEAEPVDPTEPIHKPKFGTGTLLMTPRDLEPKPDLPSSSEWEAAASSRSRPDVLSEPTMLIEPRPQARSRTPQPPYVAQAQPMLLQHPRASYPPARTTEPPPPTTERILRTAATSLSTPPQPMAPAATALALRPPEYNNAPPHALSGKLDDRLVLLTEPDSPRAVGFRALRDSLLSKSLPRVLAVTSISGREGKTTCAINVALALAEQPGARVLLVDFNFMDPALGAIFAIDRLSPVIGPQPWLGSYYIGAVNNSFHVCAIPPSAVKKNQRFEQHRFDTLIDQLCRGNYDYLVLDTPAMSASPAVSTLVGGADGVLFAVRAGGTTTGRELRRATENLPPKKALGVALIDAK